MLARVEDVGGCLMDGREGCSEIADDQRVRRIARVRKWRTSTFNGHSQSYISNGSSKQQDPSKSRCTTAWKMTVAQNGPYLVEENEKRIQEGIY